MTPILEANFFKIYFMIWIWHQLAHHARSDFFCDLKFKSLLVVMRGDSQNLSFEVRGLCFQAKKRLISKNTLWSSSKSQVFRSIQDSHGYFAVLERLFPPTCKIYMLFLQLPIFITQSSATKQTLLSADYWQSLVSLITADELETIQYKQQQS